MLLMLHVTGKRYGTLKEEHLLSNYVDHKAAFISGAAWVLGSKTGSGKTLVVAAMLYLFIDETKPA